jgi:hypothetical protein
MPRAPCHGRAESVANSARTAKEPLGCERVIHGRRRFKAKFLRQLRQLRQYLSENNALPPFPRALVCVGLCQLRQLPQGKGKIDNHVDPSRHDDARPE